MYKQSRGETWEISRWAGCFFLTQQSSLERRSFFSLFIFYFHFFLSFCLSFSLYFSLCLSVSLFLYPSSVSPRLSLYYCYLICKSPSKNGSRPEMRRTNLMKFQYTFNIMISIVIKHFAAFVISLFRVRRSSHSV